MYTLHSGSTTLPSRALRNWLHPDQLAVDVGDILSAKNTDATVCFVLGQRDGLVPGCMLDVTKSTPPSSMREKLHRVRTGMHAHSFALGQRRPRQISTISPGEPSLEEGFIGRSRRARAVVRQADVGGRSYNEKQLYLSR